MIIKKGPQRCGLMNVTQRITGKNSMMLLNTEYFHRKCYLFRYVNSVRVCDCNTRRVPKYKVVNKQGKNAYGEHRVKLMGTM